MKSTCLVTLLLAFTALSVLGAPPNQDSGSRQKKEPWEWTDSERVAARLDPAFIKANSRQPSNSSSLHIATEGASSDFAFTLEGSKNPEIFLPFELFMSLMNGFDADPDSRSHNRVYFSRGIAESGYKDPDAFWRELEPLVSVHATALRDHLALYERRDRADRKERDAVEKQISEHQTTVCRSRFQALEAARAHFGRQTFDRLLYTVVAPGLTQSSAAPDSNFASHYLFIAGGCR
jgi:hypothetical protein